MKHCKRWAEEVVESSQVEVFNTEQGTIRNNVTKQGTIRNNISKIDYIWVIDEAI